MSTKSPQANFTPMPSTSPTMSTEERYMRELITLKCNSKPIINSLTMMAEDEVRKGNGPLIVQLIERHISKVRQESKLPILYLIDSIVKNLKGEYVGLFTKNIASTFSGVFHKADERTRANMFKLRGTWTEVFPHKTMVELDKRVHQIDAGWPMLSLSLPPPTSQVHVNPKFIKNPKTPSPPAQPGTYDILAIPNLITQTPPLNAAEAKMREQLLLKHKELIELQTKKIELELLHAKAQLEEQARKPTPVPQEPSKEQMLSNQAEVAKQKTMMASSLMALANSNNTSTTSSIITKGSNISNTKQTGYAADPRLAPRVFAIPTPTSPATVTTPTKQKQAPPTAPPPPKISSPKPDSSHKAQPSPVKTESHSKSSSKKSESTSSRDKKRTESSSSSEVNTKSIKETIKKEKVSRSTGSGSSRSSLDSPRKSSNGSSTRTDSKKKHNDAQQPDYYEDETLGYSGLTIKPKPSSSSSPKSKSSSSSKSSTSEHSKSEVERHESSRSKSKSRNESPKPKEDPITKSSPKKSGHSSRPTDRDRRRGKKIEDPTPPVPIEPKKERERDRERDKERDRYAQAKTAVLSRNYRKRVKEEEEQSSMDKSSDIDLRFDGLKDIDLRQKSKGMSETNRGNQGRVARDSSPGAIVTPPKKPRNSSLIDDLFGREDVDLRQVTSSSSTSWSQVKRPTSEVPVPMDHHESSGGRVLRDHDIREILQDSQIPRDPLSPIRSIIPESTTPTTTPSCDPLGRPLVFTRLPDDPTERKRSLETRQLSISTMDPVNQFMTDFMNGTMGGSGPQDIKKAFTTAEERLNLGQLTNEQYNLIIKQLVQMLEVNKIREVQEGQLKASSESAPGAGDPWGEMGLLRSSGFNGPPQPSGRFNGPPRGGGGGWTSANPNWNPPQQQPQAGPGGLPPPPGPNPFVEAAARPAPVIENLIPEANPLEVAQLENDRDSTIPLDKVPRHVRFYSPTLAIAIMTNDPVHGEQPREINFDPNAPPITLYVNKEPFQCKVGEPRAFYLDRVKHYFQIGLPTKELIIDGIGYECCFGGPPIQVQLDGRWHRFFLESPAPQVIIGKLRYDLLAGRTTLFIDGNPFIIYLDSKPQLLDVCGFPIIFRLIDDFHTVTLNGRPFPARYGAPPVPITLPGGRFHYFRFSGIPPMTQEAMVNYVRLRHAQATDEAGQNVPHAQGQFRPRGGMFYGRARGVRGVGPRGQPFYRPPPPPHMMLRPNYEPDLDLQQGGAQFIHQAYSTDKPELAGVEEEERKVELGPTAASITSEPMNVQDLLSKLMLAGLLPTETPKREAAPEKKPEVKETPPAEADPMETDEPEKTEQKKEAGPRAKKDAPIVPPPLETVDIQLKDNLKERRDKLVLQIITGVQCGSCGLRFPPDQTMRYTQHLDWHFRQNRREKANYKKALSRKWYYDLSDWIQFEEIEDLEERVASLFEPTLMDQRNNLDDEHNTSTVLNPDAYTVPVQGRDEATCPLCGENFDQFYNEEEEEWKFRDAIIPEENNEENAIYHPVCYQDSLSKPGQSPVPEPEPQPMEEEDEVLILREGKKEVVLMEIALDEDEEPKGSSSAIDQTDSGPESKDSKTDNSHSDKLLDPSSDKSNNIVPGPSPPLVVAPPPQSIPGITQDDPHSHITVFDIALAENDSEPDSSDPNKSLPIITYCPMQFDFPKIKTEPQEWDGVTPQVFVSPALDSQAPPEDVTLDDDDTSDSILKAKEDDEEMELAPLDVDLTGDDEDSVGVNNTSASAPVAEIDGNLQFKGNATVKQPTTQIRINIAGLNIGGSSPKPLGSPNPDVPPASTTDDGEKASKPMGSSLTQPLIEGSGSSSSPRKLGSPKPSEEKGPHESLLPTPPSSQSPKPIVQPILEPKSIKPRLQGRKLIHCPKKTSGTGGDNSAGLCVIS